MPPTAPAARPAKPGHMCAHDASLRVLPCSKSFERVTPEEVSKLYYSTTAAMDYLGQPCAAGSESENMVHVHCIGRRAGKYMGYQYCTAPLLGKHSCTYYQDFCPKTLGDNVTCTMLSKVYKEKSTSSATGNRAGLPFQARTSYTDDFQGYDLGMVKDIAEAAEVCKEKHRTCNLQCSGESLEKISMTHTVYRPTSGSMGRAERAPKPRTNLCLPREGTPFATTTAYRETFGQPPRPFPRRPKKIQKISERSLSCPVAKKDPEAPPPPDTKQQDVQTRRPEFRRGERHRCEPKVATTRSGCGGGPVPAHQQRTASAPVVRDNQQHHPTVAPLKTSALQTQLPERSASAGSLRSKAPATLPAAPQAQRPMSAAELRSRLHLL